MIELKTKLVIALLIFISGWFLIENHNSTVTEMSRLKSELATTKANVEYTKWSGAITDEVFKEYISEKITAIRDTEQIRKEAIDEYLKSGSLQKPTQAVCPTVDIEDDNRRVGVLAGRMQEYYCTARPDDLRCNPKRSSN